MVRTQGGPKPDLMDESGVCHPVRWVTGGGVCRTVYAEKFSKAGQGSRDWLGPHEKIGFHPKNDENPFAEFKWRCD